MLVKQILSSKPEGPVVSVTPDDTIADAVKLLSEKRIGTVVVMTGDDLVGILSERDIVRELGKSGAGMMSHKVKDYMTSKLITCTTDERSDVVLAKMSEGRFRHMPVVEDGTLLGLISIGDVVKARLSQLSMEKDALQGMIMGH